MSKELAVFVGIDLLINGLSTLLNIPRDKLHEYYQDSREFRDYLNSLTDTLRAEAKNDLYNLTPSTTPRFDIPWITEELKKRQDDIFNIKNQITEIQTKTRDLENQSYEDALTDKMKERHGDNQFVNTTAKVLATITKPFNTHKFNKQKKEKVDQYNKQTAQLANQAHQISKAPLINKNPTYQTIQERKKNAQIQK